MSTDTKPMNIDVAPMTRFRVCGGCTGFRICGATRGGGFTFRDKSFCSVRLASYRVYCYYVVEPLELHTPLIDKQKYMSICTDCWETR